MAKPIEIGFKFDRFRLFFLFSRYARTVPVSKSSDFLASG